MLAQSTAVLSLEGITLAALLGLAGQAIRVIPGIRKTAQDARERGQHLADAFCGLELWLSLVYGAAAGVLAAIALAPEKLSSVSSDTALQLLGAGYVGSDFVEGLIGRLRPTAPMVPDSPSRATPTPAATGAGATPAGNSNAGIPSLTGNGSTPAASSGSSRLLITAPTL